MTVKKKEKSKDKIKRISKSRDRTLDEIEKRNKSKHNTSTSPVASLKTGDLVKNLADAEKLFKRGRSQSASRSKSQPKLNTT